MTRNDRERRRPIAIWGAYGGMNIGDEAILVSMVDLLRGHGLDPKVVITQDRPEPAVVAAYAKLGLATVPFRSGLALFRALRSCDLICGGGQLLDDRGGLGFPVGFTGSLVLLNRLLGGKPILFGIGAEPIQRGATKWMVKRLYGLSRAAMVRDNPSAVALADAGYPKERIQVGGDIVLTMEGDNKPAESTASLLIVPNQDPQRAGGLEGTFETLARTAVTAGWSVTVMAHDRRDAYDAGEVARLEQALSDDSISYVVPASIEEGLSRYRRSDVVASARMHPLILSVLNDVRPLAIPVVPKVETLVRDMHLCTLPPGSTETTVLTQLDAAAAWDIAPAKQTIAERQAAIETCLGSLFALETPIDGGGH